MNPINRNKVFVKKQQQIFIENNMDLYIFVSISLFSSCSLKTNEWFLALE